MKGALAVLLAVLAMAVAYASAASLGGLPATNLGAESHQVSSCDSDGVDVSYGGYDYSDHGVVLTELHLSGISPACDGHMVEVAVGDFPDVVGEGSAVIDVDGADWPVVVVPISNGPTASELSNIAISITGRR